MSLNTLLTAPNPELSVNDSSRTPWNTAETRRWGFHNMHLNNRYGLSLRSREVLVLKRDIDMRIARLERVRCMTETSIFSALAVIKDNALLYEAYAPDFAADRPHSIQSITKTTLNLIYGQLVAQGKINLDSTINQFIPEIGTGYATASVRDVLDMNVINDYSEDYTDPLASVFKHELAMGWRIPAANEPEITNHEFLCGIKSDDVVNTSSEIHYKSANTDVLAWVAEIVSGRSLRDHLIDIIEASGLEHTFHVSTDRTGMPILDGGGSMTARDLARYGQLFVRGGMGVNGHSIGNSDFIEFARKADSKHFPAPRDWIRYCLHLQTNGQWVGHGGFGGQYLLANPETGISVAFFSVLEDEAGYNHQYIEDVVLMCQEVAAAS